MDSPDGTSSPKSTILPLHDLYLTAQLALGRFKKVVAEQEEALDRLEQDLANSVEALLQQFRQLCQGQREALHNLRRKANGAYEYYQKKVRGLLAQAPLYERFQAFLDAQKDEQQAKQRLDAASDEEKPFHEKKLREAAENRQSALREYQKECEQYQSRKRRPPQRPASGPAASTPVADLSGETRDGSGQDMKQEREGREAQRTAQLQSPVSSADLPEGGQAGPGQKVPSVAGGARRPSSQQAGSAAVHVTAPETTPSVTTPRPTNYETSPALAGPLGENASGEATVHQPSPLPRPASQLAAAPVGQPAKAAEEPAPPSAVPPRSPGRSVAPSVNPFEEARKETPQILQRVKTLYHSCEQLWPVAATCLLNLKRCCENFGSGSDSAKEEDRSTALLTHVDLIVRYISDLDRCLKRKDDAGRELPSPSNTHLSREVQVLRDQLFNFVERCGGVQVQPVRVKGRPESYKDLKWLPTAAAAGELDTIVEVLHQGYGRPKETGFDVIIPAVVYVARCQ